MADQVRYTLKLPIEFTNVAGDRLPELDVREVVIRSDVRAKDMRVIDSFNGGVAKTIALIAQLCNLQIIQVDKLGIEDFGALGEMLTGFMPDGLLTGETA